jgi:hypothetical protein
MTKQFLTFLFLLSCAECVFAAESAEVEVELLITAVAASDCIFERNGTSYTSAQAADHLRLKFRRGIKNVKSAEDFIDRLASKSSISDKPYFITCPQAERETSGSWLNRQLNVIRH